MRSSICERPRFGQRLRHAERRATRCLDTRPRKKRRESTPSRGESSAVSPRSRSCSILAVSSSSRCTTRRRLSLASRMCCGRERLSGEDLDRLRPLAVLLRQPLARYRPAGPKRRAKGTGIRRWARVACRRFLMPVRSATRAARRWVRPRRLRVSASGCQTSGR